MTVFSIIHRKQFYTIARFKENPITSTNSRIRNLLRMSGLQDRELKYGTKRIKELSEIDYDSHMAMLQQEIDRSKQFLQESVRGEYKSEL